MSKTESVSGDYEPVGRNPDYDGSPESEARRMRSSRDRARRERDELQARVVELERLSLESTREEKRLRKALRKILTSDDLATAKAIARTEIESHVEGNKKGEASPHSWEWYSAGIQRR